MAQGSRHERLAQAFLQQLWHVSLTRTARYFHFDSSQKVNKFSTVCAKITER